MSAAVSARLSSNRTFAMAASSFSVIWTSSTPGTRLSARLTIGPHSSQVALATLSATVRSAAKAMLADSRIAASAASGSIFMDDLLGWLGIEKEASRIGEAHSDGNDDGCDPQADLGHSARRRPSAVGALDALGGSRLAIDKIEARAEAADRKRDEERLIGLERRKIADPGAADAGEEQRERHDAARRGSQCRQNAANRQQRRLVAGFPARRRIGALQFAP